MAIKEERVLAVKHWNDTLFSFTTSRDASFRFANGHFTMIGLRVDGRPLMRAYSMVSPNYADHLEFFSIKVQDGPLTSRLQHIKEGDALLVNQKATGTLETARLLPGRRLYLMATGTGLAPFMSIIRDPDIYDAYEQVILTHGVRLVSELAYAQTIEALPGDELLGPVVGDRLLYYPTVTREPFRTNGRLTDLLRIGKLGRDLGLPPPSPDEDRFMLCGSPSMLKDFGKILDGMGFAESTGGVQGGYVVERAFVES